MDDELVDDCEVNLDNIGILAKSGDCCCCGGGGGFSFFITRLLSYVVGARVERSIFGLEAAI